MNNSYGVKIRVISLRSCVNADECQLHSTSFSPIILDFFFHKFIISIHYPRQPHASIWSYPAPTLSTFYTADLFQVVHLSAYRLSTKLQFVWGSFKKIFFKLVESLLSCFKKKKKKNQTFEMICASYLLSLCASSLCVGHPSLCLSYGGRSLFLHSLCICIVLHHWWKEDLFRTVTLSSIYIHT